MIRRRLPLPSILLHFCLAPFTARAADFTANAQLEIPSVRDETTLEVEWAAKTIPVGLQKVNGQEVLQAKLVGKLKVRDWSLVQGKSRLPLDESGQFTDALEITGPETSAEFIGISRDGTVQRVKVKVRYFGWNGYSEWRKEEQQRRVQPRIWASGGVAQSSFESSNTGQGSTGRFTSLAPLSFGAGASLPLSEEVHLSGGWRSISVQPQATAGISLIPATVRSNFYDLELQYLPASWTIPVSQWSHLRIGFQVGAQFHDTVFILLTSPLSGSLASVKFPLADAGAVLQLQLGLDWESEFRLKAKYPIFKIGATTVSNPLFWEGSLNLTRWVGERTALGVHFSVVSESFDYTTDLEGFSSAGHASQLSLDTQLRLSYRL